MSVQILTQPLRGAPLAMAALQAALPQWYVRAPASGSEWRARAEQVRAEFAGRDWLAALAPALEVSDAAAQRLERVADGRGIVVTTGQQPGLFGGPIYTWSKAFSALALADAIQEHTGIPTAPVFWAATDDTDFTEASVTTIAVSGGAQTIRLEPAGPSGVPLAEMPLGDVSAQLAAFMRGAGSAPYPEPLNAVSQAYTPDATIGGAYVQLLRRVLEPLGIAVLDAAHAAVRTAAFPLLRESLVRADEIAAHTTRRSQAIAEAGYKVQVQEVPGLTLVFRREGNRRARVPVKRAATVAVEAASDELGPNVLLRPVVERYILPTVAYVAGPAEIGYFAQVSAVSDALGRPEPLAVPRWSGTIIEPHVADILARIGATPDDFRDPHAVETRTARDQLDGALRDELHQLRDSVHAHVQRLVEHTDTKLLPISVLDGVRRQLLHRVDRLERRYIAAVKRAGCSTLHDVATARGSLYPNGVPQERALNFVPLLARYGPALRDAMMDAARVHTQSVASHAQ